MRELILDKNESKVDKDSFFSFDHILIELYNEESLIGIERGLRARYRVALILISDSFKDY